MATSPKKRPARLIVLLALPALLLVGVFTGHFNKNLGERLTAIWQEIRTEPTAELTAVENALPAAPKRRTREEIGIIFDQAIDAYEVAYKKALNQYKTERLAALEDFSTASGQAFSGALEAKITHRNITRLAYLMARDIVSSDERARDAEWINTHLVKPLQPALESYHLDIAAAGARLQQTQKEALATLEQALLQGIEPPLPGLPPTGDAITPLAEALNSGLGRPQLLLAAGLPAALVPLDLHALGANQRAALSKAVSGQVSRAYQKFAERHLAQQAKRLAAALGTVLVDGPLPVGDIIAGGMALWTAWELATLTSGLREDLRDGYDRGLAEMRRDFTQTTVPQIRSAAEQHLEKLRLAREPFINSICEAPDTP